MFSSLRFARAARAQVESMLLRIDQRCHECWAETHFLYDTEEEKLYPSNMIGCPGKGCTNIHEFHLFNVDEEQAEELKDGLSWDI